MAQMREPVVGIFNSNAMAEHAIEALRDAGFSNNEILYSGQSPQGGFFDNLKSWVSGEQAAPAEEIAKGLMNIGVPREAADYCAHEYESGHPLIAVQSAGHEQDAEVIIRSNGGHGYRETGAASSGMETDTSARSRVTDTDTTRPGAQAGTRGMGDRPTGATRPDFQPGTTGQPGMARGREESGLFPDALRGRPTDTTPATGQPYPDTTRKADLGTGQTMESDRMNIPLREEQLRAEKQRVQSGEINVRKEVVSEEKTINVPVSHEEVVIERRPFSEARSSDTPIGQEQNETIRIPVSEERVNISKETVQTGEVEINKRAIEEQQRFSDTVRREEPRIEGTVDAESRVEGIDLHNRETRDTGSNVEGRDLRDKRRDDDDPLIGV